MKREAILRALELGRVPQDTSDMTPETHEQAMVCTACALAGFVPSEHFPQTPGLWDQPCPQCNENAVWVTEVRPRETATGEIDTDYDQSRDM